ncbi:unnamed protein product, partial [Closterium sp. NIES-53]
GKVKLSAPDHKFWVIEQAANNTNSTAPPTPHPPPHSPPYLPLPAFIALTLPCPISPYAWQGRVKLSEPDYKSWGKVKLSSPEYKFWVIEQAAECTNNGLPPNMPLRVFIGREVAVSDRTVATKYELSRRRYLGPTAMDAELSLLMANQALARRGALMYDPFVGTGSILVAAAHFGAITLGADIDIRVVRDGKGPNRDVWANFHQYSLQPPVGLLRADNNCPPWRQDLRE